MIEETEPRVDELLARTEKCDLSALLTLRVLAAEVNGESWTSCGSLVGDLQREFARMGDSPDTAVTAFEKRPLEAFL